MPDFNTSPQEQNHFQLVYSLNNCSKPFIAFFAARQHLLVLFRHFPQVIGSMLMEMFHAITASRLNIFSPVQLDRRTLFIVAMLFTFTLGVAQVPQILEHLAELFRNIFSFDVATSDIAAWLLHIILPESKQ